MSRLFALFISLLLVGCVTGAVVEAEPNGSKTDLVLVATWPGALGFEQDAWFVFHCANDVQGTMRCMPHGMSIAKPGERLIALDGVGRQELDDGQSVEVYYRAEDTSLGPPPRVYAEVCQETGACQYLAADDTHHTELSVINSLREAIGARIYGESVTRAFLQHERLGPFLTRLRQR